MPREGVGAGTTHPNTLGAEEGSRVELGMLWGFWDGRRGIQAAMAWETTKHVRIDVAKQGTSREKQIQAGTAHAVA